MSIMVSYGPSEMQGMHSVCDWQQWCSGLMGGARELSRHVASRTDNAQLLLHFLLCFRVVAGSASDWVPR